MPSHNSFMHWTEKHQRPMIIGAGTAVASRYGLVPMILPLPPIALQGAAAWALNKQKNSDLMAGMVGGTAAVMLLGLTGM